MYMMSSIWYIRQVIMKVQTTAEGKIMYVLFFIICLVGGFITDLAKLGK